MKRVEIMQDLILYTQTEAEKKLRANTYLLLGDKPILVDAGFLIKEDVDEVVLTHCHGDHVKYCPDYKKRGAKIMISEHDAVHLEAYDEVMQPEWAREVFGEVKPCIPDVKLVEGDHIKNSNWNLKVVHVPGHTPGSIALFDENRKIIFTGDTMYGSETFGSWDHPGGNKMDLTKSILKLKKLNFNMLCSGHGSTKD